MRVLIFGDSITQGFWDTEGGWVARLRQSYDEKKISGQQEDPPTVFNLGISGDTTEGVLRRFENEVVARKWRWPYENLTIVFAIGINDSITEDGIERSTPKQYRQELKLLITKAQKISNKVLFIGLTPCEEVDANSRPGKYKEFTNSRIEQFDEVLKNICAGENLPYIELFRIFQSKMVKGKKLFTDGLHPNDAGHELIASLVKPELEKLLAA